MSLRQLLMTLHTHRSLLASAWSLSGCLPAAVFAVACGNQPPASAFVVPQYNRDTGKLTSVDVDRDKDGRFEARAFMDGTRVQRIEIDSNADGKPDRWEYYAPAGASGGESVIARAEEASETTGKISRWEYFAQGTITRVEEDVDEDGRVDKWEQYRAGKVASVDLDLSGSGKPERRLIYEPGGKVTSQSLSATTGNSVVRGS